MTSQRHITHETSPGQRIMTQSFAIIEKEMGAHPLPVWAFAVVRRMIHASADFDFAHTLRFSPDFEKAVCAAFRGPAVIVTDTEMVRLGIRNAISVLDGLSAVCYLNLPETADLAISEGLTRSAAGIRLAVQRHANPVVVIGNAPTALDQALQSLADGYWQPAAIIGIPVGFVGVEEAKKRLLSQSLVPYLTCTGRKGGSSVTAAAVNALVELARGHAPPTS